MRDPVELEVFKNLYHSIAEEMGAVLRRTSFSPNIKERRDYSCAVFDSDDLAIGIEDSAGVVTALFDIGRKGSAAQDGSHFLGDRMVEVLENLEFDGITHIGDECTSSRGDHGLYWPSPPKQRSVDRRLSMRPLSMRPLAVFAALVAMFSVSLAKDDLQVGDFVKQHLSSIGTEQARAAVKNRAAEGTMQFHMQRQGGSAEAKKYLSRTATSWLVCS